MDSNSDSIGNQMEFNEDSIQLTLLAVRLILASRSRDDLVVSLGDKDWKKLDEIEENIRDEITLKGDEDSEMMATCFLTMIKIYMNLLPSKLEDIPEVLKNLRKSVTVRQRRKIDRLIEHYNDTSGASFVDYILLSRELSMEVDPIISKSLDECSSFLTEMTDIIPDTISQV